MRSWVVRFFAGRFYKNVFKETVKMFAIFYKRFFIFASTIHFQEFSSKLCFEQFFFNISHTVPLHCVFWQSFICKIYPISARIQQMKWIIKIDGSYYNFLIYISIYFLFYMKKNIFFWNDAIQDAIWIQIVWR